MNEPNRFSKILNETAFCSKHLTARVNRNPKTGEWPKTCERGGYLKKMGRPGVCAIVIEGDGYSIQ